MYQLRLVALSAALCVMASSATARAQSTGAPHAEPPEETEAVDLFGFRLMQNERFKISGFFVAAWSHDGAQAALGFPVGRTPAEPLMFVFPPTAAGAGVWTWIGFLVGLPLLAGGAVTALVLLRGGKDATRAGGATRGPQA